MILDELDAALTRFGLMTRGAFHPGADDDVPAGTATLVMIGNAGPGFWDAFAATRPAGPDPMDRWTAAAIDPVAEAFGGDALYPFAGPPYHPFQRWAMRADAVEPSPIGPLIHPTFGLWHAYRAALVFRDRHDIPTPARAPSPCESCVERPCLGTCPVDAFAPGVYDVPACRAHIATAAGADCLGTGCRARRACPVGRDHIYPPAQAAFHMRHFLSADG